MFLYVAILFSVFSPVFLFFYFLIDNRRVYPDQCQSNPNEKHACKWDTPQDQQVSNEATQMCEHLLKDEKFEKCRKVLHHVHMDRNRCALWFFTTLVWLPCSINRTFFLLSS